MFFNTKKILSSIIFAATIVVTGSGMLTLNKFSINSQAEEDQIMWNYNISDDEVTANITEYLGDETNVVIPSEINGYLITGIEENSFYFCKNILSVEIPETINFISPDAFSTSENISDFNVSENNQTYVSYDGIIFSKDMTEIVKFPSAKEYISYDIPKTVKIINPYAFYAAKNLDSITIPDSVSIIGEKAFFRCKGLTSIDLPEGLTVISDSLFMGSGIENIVIPSSVLTIEYGAFSFCDNLTSITVNEGLETIADACFYECKNLPEINLPETVSEIGENAFEDCNKIDGGITIIGNPGSYIHDYSSSTNIAFKDESKIDIIQKRYAPDFNGDLKFDISDLSNAKFALLNMEGFSVSSEQWLPIDGISFSLSDLAFLKMALIRIDGYEFDER